MIGKVPRLNNSYRHYNLPVFFPCVALLGSNWRLGNTPMPFLHFHNCIEIGHCLSGSGVITIESTDYPYKTGDFVFIAENTNHSSYRTCTEDSIWEYTYLDGHLMFSNILPEDFFIDIIFGISNRSSVITKEAFPNTHMMLLEIFKELHDKSANYKDSLKGLFLALLVFMSRTHNESVVPVKSDLLIHEALKYIYANYSQKLSIAQIADECCHLSEAHFRKRFNELMHTSPLDYINLLRIQKACQLIAENELHMKEIALLSGFTTLSSFNRNFQALLGCSPSEWKKNSLENQDVITLTTLEEGVAAKIFIV